MDNKSGVTDHAGSGRTNDTARTVLLLAVVAGLAGLPLRWLCTSDVPMSWDGVQYILAIDDFDVARHQPHPPGYYLFVWSARVLHAMHLPPLTSLLLVSGLAIAGLTALMVVWAGRLEGSRGAVAAAALCLSSPLLFLLAADERSYAAGTLGSGAVGVLCWRLWQARHRAGRRDALLSGIALGVLAGLRQTDALLLVPLWAVSLLWGRRRATLWGVVGLALTLAAWAVPFLWGVGGVGEYLEISSRLASLFVRLDELADQLSGVSARATVVCAGAFCALGVGWLFVPLVMGTPLRQRLAFIGLWLLPALLVFLLGHAANVLYVGMLAPALLIVGAVALARVLRVARSWPVRLAIVVLVSRPMCPSSSTVSRCRAVTGQPWYERSVRPALRGIAKAPWPSLRRALRGSLACTGSSRRFGTPCTFCRKLMSSSSR